MHTGELESIPCLVPCSASPADPHTAPDEPLTSSQVPPCTASSRRRGLPPPLRAAHRSDAAASQRAVLQQGTGAAARRRRCSKAQARRYCSTGATGENNLDGGQLVGKAGGGNVLRGVLMTVHRVLVRVIHPHRAAVGVDRRQHHLRAASRNADWNRVLLSLRGCPSRKGASHCSPRCTICAAASGGAHQECGCAGIGSSARRPALCGVAAPHVSTAWRRAF